MGKEEKKEILIVNSYFRTGGILSSLQFLVKELVKEYSVSLLFLTKPRNVTGFEGAEILPSPFLLDCFLSTSDEFRDNSYTLTRRVIRKFLKKLEKIIGKEKVIKLLSFFSKTHHYDVVISFFHDEWRNDGKFSYGGTNWYALKKVKAKNKITWIHGEPSFTGLDKKRALFLSNNFNHIVCVTENCKKTFDRLVEMPKNSSKCVYVRNCFDAEYIRTKAEEPISLTQKKLNIVTVSRVTVAAKRIDRVNEIAKRLADDGYQFHWYVVGPGPKYSELLQQSLSMGLGDYVTYTGKQNNPYRYLANADITVVTSDSEAFCNVITESLICGTPVVTTDFPGAYETVADGENGFIVEKSVNSLYEGIKRYFTDRQILEKQKRMLNSFVFSNNESIQKLKTMIEE